MKPTFGSLFAGIGGFDLGLERAGFECRWQVEIDDYATRVLEKHWPDIPKIRDVQEFPPPSAIGEIKVDLICGGFPCQDISYCGHGAGIEGERSGLWSEFKRIICIFRPRFVVVENVSALLTRGIDRVLSDLAESGYDAEWDCIPAYAVGAPHYRDRVFIVAYPAGQSVQKSPLVLPEGIQGEFGRVGGQSVSHCWEANQPSMVGMAHGVPSWVGGSKGLGNAVVPQVAEYIGRRIINSITNTRREANAK